MPEEAQVAEETVEEKTAEVESPTTEENETPVEETEVEQAPEETEVEAEPEGAQAELPEEAVSEGFNEKQAEAFKQQRLEIKRLKEELAARQKTESALHQFVRAPQDPSIDTTRMLVQRELDLTKTRIKYPELDPDGDNFDRDLEEDVAAKWSLGLISGTGKSFMACAKEVIERRDKQGKKVAKKEVQEAAQEAKESVSLKERSSAAAPTRSSGARTTAADQESLRERTRLGDPDAFAQRIRQAGG